MGGSCSSETTFFTSQTLLSHLDTLYLGGIPVCWTGLALVIISSQLSPFQEDFPWSMGPTLPRAIWEVTSHLGVEERHSQWPLLEIPKYTLFDLGVETTLWWLSCSRVPSGIRLRYGAQPIPVFSRLFVLTLEDCVLGKPGQLVSLTLCWAHSSVLPFALPSTSLPSLQVPLQSLPSIKHMHKHTIPASASRELAFSAFLVFPPIWVQASFHQGSCLWVRGSCHYP